MEITVVVYAGSGEGSKDCGFETVQKDDNCRMKEVQEAGYSIVKGHNLHCKDHTQIKKVGGGHLKRGVSRRQVSLKLGKSGLLRIRLLFGISSKSREFFL